MGTSRTSNKDLADKLDTLISLLTAQAQAQPVIQAAQPATTVAAPTTAKGSQPVKVSKDYLAKMMPRWQKLADKRGETVIGFAYRKANHKVGLWGCSPSEYADVASRESTIGAIAEVHPTK